MKKVNKKYYYLKNEKEGSYDIYKLVKKDFVFIKGGFKKVMEARYECNYRYSVETYYRF